MKSTTLLLGLVSGLLISAYSDAQEGSPKPPELKVLERFVGAWDSETVGKPAEWTPKGVKQTGTNKYEWVLDGRFMQNTEWNAEGSVALGWWTYDTRAKTYRGWFFLSDASIVEWKGRWDEERKGLRVEAIMDNAIVFTGANRFPDKDTYEWTCLAKDKAGKVYLDMKETHRRRNTPLDKPKERKGEPGPAELKVLEGYLGNWKAETVRRVAEWNPKEVRTTGTVTNEWVLDGRFMQQRGKEFNGAEHIQVRTYDPQNKQFRHWHFDSLGGTASANGTWNEDSKTMTWKADLGNGITVTNTVRFVGSDRIEWRVLTRNDAGKVFVDAEGKWTRKK
jgi:hypothetical protein